MRAVQSTPVVLPLLATIASAGCADEPYEPCLASDPIERDCSAREPTHPLDFTFGSPLPGQALDLDRINITGRIEVGYADSISADGQPGTLVGDSFTVRDVALAAAGPSVIRVEAANADGQARTRLLLVSRGPMPALLVSVAIDDRRRVTVGTVSAIEPVVRGITGGPGSSITYRLRDDSGELVLRGEVPGSDLTIIHGQVDGQLCSWTEVDPRQIDVVVPDIAGARTIEFVDESDCLLGQDAL